jgi:hypothetical protein
MTDATAAMGVSEAVPSVARHGAIGGDVFDGSIPESVLPVHDVYSSVFKLLIGCVW